MTSYTCLDVVKGHTGSVAATAFHPTQRLLASGSGDKTVRIWKIGQCRAEILPIRKVFSLGILPDDTCNARKEPKHEEPLTSCFKVFPAFMSAITDLNWHPAGDK